MSRQNPGNQKPVVQKSGRDGFAECGNRKNDCETGGGAKRGLRARQLAAQKQKSDCGAGNESGQMEERIIEHEEFRQRRYEMPHGRRQHRANPHQACERN